MLYKLRKLLCYTIILTLFNTSFQPVFAFPDSDKDFDISSLPHSQRISNPSLEVLQVAESDIISRFCLTPLKTVLGGAFQVTRSAIRHPLKAITMALPFLTPGIYAGNEFRVSQNASSSTLVYVPSVAGSSTRDMLVAWHGNQAPGIYDIYGRGFFSNGTLLSNEFLINQNTIGNQDSPSVASSANEEMIVVWHGNQNGNYDIYGRVLFLNGTAPRDEFLINENTTSDQYSPSVAISPERDMFVAWQGAQLGNYDIYGRVLSSNGTALSDEFDINQVKIGTQSPPLVAYLRDRKVIVVWFGNQAGNYDIYGRIFFSNGTAFSDEFPINQNTTSQQTAPSIAILPNGNLIVVWEGNQTGNYDIYGRVLSPDRTPISEEFLVNENTTADQRYPSIAITAEGDVFITWYGNQAGPYDTYGRIFDAATLSSFLYPAPSPVSPPAPVSAPASVPLLVSVPGPSSVPAPLSAPASILASAPLLAPTPKPASVSALSPTLSPSPFTQSLSGIESSGALSSSTSSVDMSTLSNTPSSIPSVQSSSRTESLETPGSSTGSPSETSWKRTVAIAGGAGGSALLFGVLGFVAIKKCCSSEKNKPAVPGIELAEEGEETSTSSPTVSSFDPNSSGFTEFVGAIHKDTTYEIWRTLSNEREKLLRPLTAKEVPVVSPSQKIDFNLGGRRFRTVYPGSNQQTGEIYAIREVLNDKAVKEFLRKDKIVRSLDHPNVMPLIDYSYRKQEFDPDETLKESSLYQVMPLGWADGVDFKKRLTPLNPDQRERIVSDTFLQLMKGLNYLHGEGVVHLNIKDSNIIYTKDGILRIADFDRAKKVGENDQITDYNRLGDMRKFSPEIIALIRSSLGGKGERVQSFSGKAADIWATGLFIWELLEDDTNNLFSNKDLELSAWVKEYTYAHFQDLIGTISLLKGKFSDSLLTILRHALRVDPSRRLRSLKIIELLSPKEMMPDERRAVFESLYQATQDAEGYSYQYIDLSSLRE